MTFPYTYGARLTELEQVESLSGLFLFADETRIVKLTTDSLPLSR